MAQWLRICLPMQGTRVWALVWEDPTCCGATQPRATTTEACTPRARAPQQEKPPQWEAHAPQWRVTPAHRNERKPVCSNEDPTQPKINFKKIYCRLVFCSGFQYFNKCSCPELILFCRFPPLDTTFIYYTFPPFSLFKTQVLSTPKSAIQC